MRFIFPVLASVVLLCTVASAEDPDVLRAKAGIEKLRALVDAGAAPRIQLEQAEDALADTKDLAILHRTMYATDLTEEQAAEMTAAAKRRLERREKQVDRIRPLMDAGLVSRAELDRVVEEAGYARKEYDLAVSRASLCQELANIARTEARMQQSPERFPAQPHADGPVERYDGGGIFTPADLEHVETAFAHRFGKALPISAVGETAVHRALGFDHRGRVDVAVRPDQPEGIWLRHYLAARRIPYFAFWQAEPGRATGAHIHMGPMSTRLAPVTAD